VIVDPSALVAISAEEPGADQISRILRDAERVQMSAASYVELCSVIDNRIWPRDSRRLDAMLAAYGVEIVPFTASQATIARDAYRDFGKSSGHRAHLNMGDCFSYALAYETDDELLFVGGGLRYTDVLPAWLPDNESADDTPTEEE